MLAAHHAVVTRRNVEEVSLARRSPQGRLFQLDALRGLAALCVVWYHFRTILPGQTRSHNPIVVVFTSGHQAVQLFFVLSGYVLGMPFWRGMQAPYPVYLTRRFFRIYVPYFAALLLAWLCARCFLYNRLPLSTWYYLTWQTPLTFRLFLSEVFMSTTPAINTAFWSLRIEAEFSLFLPLFCWVVLRMPAWIVLMLCFGLYTAGELAANQHLSLRLTTYPMFIIGLLLSYHARALADWWAQRGTAVHMGMLMIACGLYLHVLPAGRFADALTGVGSAMLIITALNSHLLSILLRHAIPEYLGRISYSLYLVHGTVLFALFDLLYKRLPLSMLAISYGALALCVAHLFCVGVEESAMRLGRRLTERARKYDTIRHVAAP